MTKKQRLLYSRRWRDRNRKKYNKIMRIYMAKRRAAARKRGLCGLCGRRHPSPGRKLCTHCYTPRR